MASFPHYTGGKDIFVMGNKIKNNVSKKFLGITVDANLNEHVNKDSDNPVKSLIHLQEFCCFCL